MGPKTKPPCAYGSKCYRKNAQHFLTYSHPDDLKNNAPKREEIEDSQTVKKRKVEKKALTSPKKLSPRKCQTKLKQTTLAFHRKVDDKTTNVSKKENLKVKTHKTSHEKCQKNSSGDDELEKGAEEHNERKNRAKSAHSKMTSLEESDDAGHENQTTHSENATLSGNSGWVFIRKTVDNDDDKDKSDTKDAYKGATTEEVIKNLFLVDMPQCFYSFFDFCKSIENDKPDKALQTCKLKLVGPFDVLLGKMNSSIDKELALCHWRYFYDPPEFQTVLATNSGFHLGYWRDDPNEPPAFIASNNSDKDCIFKCEAENIFGAVYHYLEGMKASDPFSKVKIKLLQNALSEWAKKHDFTLEKSTDKIAARQKKVVTKSFHKLGIVVPVEKKTEVGYRPLLITDANLKKTCKLIMDAEDESERDSLWENLRPHITAANIANDECDFGMSLELGIDLFCMGSPIFHRSIEHLLSVAYTLLNRNQFVEIIKAHLKRRKNGHDLSVILDK